MGGGGGGYRVIAGHVHTGKNISIYIFLTRIYIFAEAGKFVFLGYLLFPSFFLQHSGDISLEFTDVRER